MPCTFTKTDYTATPCPECKQRPLVSDRASETGRTVTYRCSAGHLSAEGSDEHKARRAWGSVVRQRALSVKQRKRFAVQKKSVADKIGGEPSKENR